MRRCARLGLFAVGYAGFLLLGALVLSAVEGPYERTLRAQLRRLKADFLRSSPCLAEPVLESFLGEVLRSRRHGAALLGNGSDTPSSWDFASAFFFSSTLVTTVGYGYTTPLSDTGKAFCIFYALLGVPFTMLVLTATVQRLVGTITTRPLEYLVLQRGWSRRAVSCGHLFLLLLVVLGAFFLVPAAIFSSLEESWSYLDAFYFCFISLCTIGLGDYVPGEQPRQHLRPLYKVSITVYLLLGLLAMLLLLQTFYTVADLHGLSDLILLPSDLPPEDQEHILAPQGPPAEVGPAEKAAVTAPLSSRGPAYYSAINR